MPTRLLVSMLPLLLTVSALSSPLQGQQDRLKALDAYIEKARQDWGVAGLAVAIVKNDSVIYAKGFGLRESGKPVPVDARTLFAIGSNTKAFTAAAIGLLVDEKKLSWDDRVTKYLPQFQLFDPYVTRELTIRDLLSHRSGLARGDAVWYASSFDRQEILRRVRYLEPSWSFRSQYGYQNIMFLAAGELAAAVAGQSWDDLVKQRFFRPLGMTASNTSVTDLRGQGNVATPHFKVGGRAVPIGWRNIDNAGPAGSINSNVLDMAQWIRLHLGEGEYQGQRLLSQRVIREMQTPHTITGSGMDTIFPMSHFSTYGQGFGLRDYYGRKLVQHSGGIDGMLSNVALIPEENLGLVVLTNTEGHNLGGALVYKILDSFLPVPARDWSSIYLKLDAISRQRADSAENARARTRVVGTKPSLSLEQYAGTYENEMYGEARVAHENGRLVLRRFLEFNGPLEHWHYDTFRVQYEQARQGKPMLTFTLDPNGKVSGLLLEGLPAFKRVAEN